MPKFRINGPAGPLDVDIAGSQPTPDEVQNLIIPQYTAHAKEFMESRGMQAPITKLSPMQQALTAGAAAVAGGGPQAAGSLYDPALMPSSLPEPQEGDARALAMYRLAERERQRVISERTEGMIETATSIGAGFAIPPAAGALGRAAFGARTIAELNEMRRLRQAAGLAGRVGVNVGAGLAGSGSVVAYRKLVNQMVEDGDLPEGFSRPDFTGDELRSRVLWDLALGGGAEVGLSGFKAARNKLLGLPKPSELQGKFAAARDLSIDMSIAQVTKHKMLEGFGKLMGSLPVIRGLVRPHRARLESQVFGAWERLFNNPFAPRSLFSDMGLDVEKSLRRDTSIALEAADAKLNTARKLSVERGVAWAPDEILNTVDDALTRRSDLAIPTTFQRVTSGSSETTRIATTEAERTLQQAFERRAASQNVSKDITKTENLFTGEQGASAISREGIKGRAASGAATAETSSATTGVTKSKVDYDKVITHTGSVPDFVGDTSVDEWMLALGGMDPKRKLTANDVMNIKRNIGEAWDKGNLSYQQKEFLFDLERATDRMLENAPDKEVAELIRQGWSDLASFHRLTSTPAAKTFTALDKNIFSRSSLVIPGGTYGDELFDYVVTGLEKGGQGSQVPRWGAERVRDLHRLMGTENFRKVTDSYLKRVGMRNFEKTPDGKIFFDWDGVRKDLGLDTHDIRREGIDEALRLSGSPRGVQQIGESIDLLQKVFGDTWSDPSTMAQRRFNLAGIKGITGMLATGAVTGAFGMTGAWGLAVAAELGLIGRYLNDPKKLKKIIEGSVRTGRDAATLNMQRNLVEMFAKDVAIQLSERGEPTPEEMDRARELVSRTGGVPVFTPIGKAPGYLPPAIDEVGENMLNMKKKTEGILRYLKGDQ